MKGKIVLVPFPFTDLSAAKLRPALVIHDTIRDVLVAFISSQDLDTPANNEVIIKSDHSGFELTSIKVDPKFRLDKVAIILKDLVIGELVK